MDRSHTAITFKEMFQQYNQTEPEYVPLTNDLLFHKVFTGNSEALAYLLCSLLDLRREEITSIDILNPVQYGAETDSRQTILDLKVHLNKERYILVEVQVRRFPSWTNRTLVYAGRQIADQVRGDDFRYENLQQVVQISIMNYTLFPDHRRFFATYSLRDESGYELSDRMKFMVMDLSASDLANKKEEQQGLVEWARAFSAKTWEEVEKVEGPGIQEVKESMTFIMSQPTERDKIFARQMAIWDYNTLINDAEQRGLAKGMEEGRQEGRQEGRREGEDRLSALITKLLNAGRDKEIPLAVSDVNFREKLYREMNIE